MKIGWFFHIFFRLSHLLHIFQNWYEKITVQRTMLKKLFRLWYSNTILTDKHLHGENCIIYYEIDCFFYSICNDFYLIFKLNVPTYDCAINCLYKTHPTEVMIIKLHLRNSRNRLVINVSWFSDADVVLWRFRAKHGVKFFDLIDSCEICKQILYIFVYRNVR